MNKIRVGMIRCDVHGWWYAALFAEHDPLLYREYDPCLHWVFYGSYWGDPKKLIVPTVPGFELVKLWDYDRKKAESMAKVFLNRPEVCDNPEDVSEDVDLVFIPDCSDEGHDHLKLAAPSLKKGIPTFVDKPFAYTIKDAQEMVNLAERYNAPLMSSSLFRQSPYIDRFRNRFAEVEPIILGIVRGTGVYGGLASYIHGISFAQNLFGEGVEWVECMGTTPLEFLHLHYPKNTPEGLEVLVINTHYDIMPVWCGFSCDVYGKTGAIHSPSIGDFEHPYAGEKILNMLKVMVETRKPPIPYESILELIKIVEAGRLAQSTGKKIYLKDIR